MQLAAQQQLVQQQQLALQMQVKNTQGSLLRIPEVIPAVHSGSDLYLCVQMQQAAEMQQLTLQAEQQAAAQAAALGAPPAAPPAPPALPAAPPVAGRYTTRI